GAMTPSLYNQEAIKSAFGITDNKQLEDLLSLEEEEETGKGQATLVETPPEEGQNFVSAWSAEESDQRMDEQEALPGSEAQEIVSASPEDALHGSIVADTAAPAEETASSKHAPLDVVTPAQIHSSSGLAQPSVPTLHHLMTGNDQLDYAESIVNLA